MLGQGVLFQNKRKGDMIERAKSIIIIDETKDGYSFANDHREVRDVIC